MDEHTKELALSMGIAFVVSLLVALFSPMRIESKIGYTIFAFIVEYFHWYYFHHKDKREISND